MRGPKAERRNCEEDVLAGRKDAGACELECDAENVAGKGLNLCLGPVAADVAVDERDEAEETLALFSVWVLNAEMDFFHLHHPKRDHHYNPGILLRSALLQMNPKCSQNQCHQTYMDMQKGFVERVAKSCPRCQEYSKHCAKCLGSVN